LSHFLSVGGNFSGLLRVSSVEIEKFGSLFKHHFFDFRRLEKLKIILEFPFFAIFTLTLIFNLVTFLGERNFLVQSIVCHAVGRYSNSGGGSKHEISRTPRIFFLA